MSIVSIQRGTITITNGNTENTVSLATVLTDTALASVTHLGSDGNTTTTAYLTLVDTENIKATRIGAADNTIVAYEVIQYSAT